jgi:hypothetical protein
MFGAENGHSPAGSDPSTRDPNHLFRVLLNKGLSGKAEVSLLRTHPNAVPNGAPAKFSQLLHHPPPRVRPLHALPRTAQRLCLMKTILAVIICSLAAVFGGCRTSTLHEVRDVAVSTNIPNATKEDVRKAIIRAGGTLGWQMKDNGADALTGTLVLRDHTAIVDIPYTATSYSILYKDSKNLKRQASSIRTAKT